MRESTPSRFTEVRADGGTLPIEREIAAECPCAIEVNGLGYAVMMLTPAYLDDFAYGFCLSERLIDAAVDVEAVDRHATEHGVVVRVTTRAALRERVLDRVRHRVSDSSCGICGIENLEQALRPLPKLVSSAPPLAATAVFAALARMRDHQPLNRATGAVHAALACDADGSVLLAREDVGRHNAFDKLIGAMASAGESWDGRFALLSSRCSYELVEKAALAGCPVLVTVSAATSLAIERARESGIRLISLARPDSFLELSTSA
ncbi:formate dehydrogenase maturation protein FdhD [Sphingomonas changbaiensis NBRC 104936]|uniref:Sulfur carrier protein FdhD n=1 Tax=Sphingomonas changbaiensis NBRC 104936 TaxID=1219043 RepID=A0A0E9MQD0_9SPHN|nr:formate dehydrogenase accessory sulfurtransferase FdhD [Sphingomonas changbaiensis]GAO39340.1 formate dehydrogenase maturation protein FdhD [Sphingomonas changbaiensis NBRC 104936]